jgi:RHS repeat-associated protein
MSMALLGLLTVLSAPAFSQTGVSDDRVSLPEGPGSLEGVGDNPIVDPNMGAMSHSVAIDTPAGFAGVTPQMALSYNSSGGSSEVGMGWKLEGLPYIERMTYRGLPRYTSDDDFCAGSDQLVRIPGTSTYRARYENSFVRYTWLQEGTGDHGHWMAEYPDGRVGYFGADADGVEDPNARVSSPQGTFRYHLVEMVDVFGHKITYQYQKIDNEKPSYIQRIAWVFTDPGHPAGRYSMTFTYEPRQDPLTGIGANLSDASAGYEVLTTQRLAGVFVFSGANQIRRYELSYEDYGDSGGFTRLARVRRVGFDNEVYPVEMSFGYSKALGGACPVGAMGCDRPYMVDMGSAPNVGTGRATLIDINGDALPDLLDTSNNQHVFYLNEMTVAGTQSFNADGDTSAVAAGGGYDLTNQFIQLIDVDGDGFTDLLNKTNQEYLRNNGSANGTVDWAAVASVSATSLPDDLDLGDDGTGAYRFLDFDNDKRIDLIRSNVANGTTYYRNGPSGYEVFTDNSPVQLGIDFGAVREEFTDMNGDGMLDLVELTDGLLRYRLNFGWGQWSDWRSINNVSAIVNAATLDTVDLEDLNGDGLSDLVLVGTGSVQYALNQNGQRFQAVAQLGDADVDQGGIPDRLGDTTVLYADMNGNGSVDVLWIQATGAASYLELFPVRPNLLSRIENGLGSLTEVTYGTSVEHMVRDGGAFAWPNRLPHPMLVVDRIVNSDGLTNLEEETVYVYHDGYYDGFNKTFRGYARVEERAPGDITEEEGLTLSFFDVGSGDDPNQPGQPDSYRNGLLLRQEVFSAGAALSETVNTYGDCPLDAIPTPSALIAAGELPIRHVCMTATVQTIKERQAEAEWVTVESSMEYDGYGNVTLSSDEGVTSKGGGACEPCNRPDEVFGAPCGAQCLGDEMYSATEYVHPDNANGRWILNAPYRMTSWGRTGGQMTESLTYYDGNAFEGLPLGELSLGLVTRATDKINDNSDDVITSVRNRYDSHGNVVETIDPNGDVGDPNTHRRVYAYDAEQLRVVLTDLLLEDADGAPYLLRRKTSYDDLWDKPVSSTAWILVREGVETSAERATFFAYDNFGRLLALAKPGDTLATPTLEVEYDLGNPVSRFITNARSVSGSAEPDLEVVRCMDGRGRTYQNRTRLSPNSYQVTGFTLFNLRSSPVKTYQPYLGTSSDCDLVPPEDVRFTEQRFDATGRTVTTVLPDGDLYGGTPSEAQSVFLPLQTLSLDPNNLDPESPHFGHAKGATTDGMGRVTRYTRQLSDTVTGQLEVRYDELGRMRGYVDDGDNEKVQEYDLLGRVTRILDPNTAGEVTFTYADAGNVLTRTDDRGKTTVQVYDGQNRKTALWDADDEEATRVTFVWDAPRVCGETSCTNTAGVLAEMSYPLRNFDGSLGTGFDFVGYDVRGRTSYRARTIGGERFETRTTYDNADRPVLVVHPGGVEIQAAFDNASRVVAVNGYVDNVVYDERGQMIESHRSDGSVTSQSHDDLMRLSGLTTTLANGTSLQAFAYDRDRGGLIRGIDDQADRIDGVTADAVVEYDSWYRVTDVTLGAGADSESLSIEFDLLDNISSMTSTASSSANVGDYLYTSSAPNAVTQAGNRNFGYDASGNVTDLDGLTLDWDYMGRLVSASGPRQATFEYGVGPNRIRKSEGSAEVLYLSEAVELRDGQASIYVRMGKNRLARIHSGALAARVLSDTAPLDSPDGKVHASDAWASWAAQEGLVTAEAGASPPKLLRSAARRLLAEVEGEVVHLHEDHLGTITLATGEGGEGEGVLGQRSYYPFGAPRSEEGFVDPHGFTGQEADESTGLTRFLYRYLDTQSGRWVSADPAFESVGAASIGKYGESSTGYAYVAGNSLNLVDPLGLTAKAAVANLKKGIKAKWNNRASQKKDRWGRSVRLVQKQNIYRRKILDQHKGAKVRTIGRLEKSIAESDGVGPGTDAFIGEPGMVLTPEGVPGKERVKASKYGFAKGKNGWTMRLNDAWMRQGIAERAVFILASPPIDKNFIAQRGSRKGNDTVYAREYKMLIKAGYERHGNLMIHREDNAGHFIGTSRRRAANNPSSP